MLHILAIDSCFTAMQVRMQSSAVPSDKRAGNLVKKRVSTVVVYSNATNISCSKETKVSQEHITMPTFRWLLLSPQLPATPSSLRVLVWRRMQHMGALNVQNGLWLLPHTSEHEQLISTLLAEMEKQGGTAWVFTAQLLDAMTQERLLARFQEERQKEYVEFASRCQEFHQELERETQALKWTFAELEENEHDVHKLSQWFHQIQRQGFFPNISGQEALARLDRCTETFQVCAQMVYAQHGVLSAEESSSALEDAFFLWAHHKKHEGMGGKA